VNPRSAKDTQWERRERSLHRALKDRYTGPDDQQEVPVEGYIIDVVSGDLLIEIQTRSFASIKHKLLDLVPRHRVRLVYPIAQAKWIVKQSRDGQTMLSRRKSPKRGRYVHLFDELISFPTLLDEERFSLEVVLTHEDEIRRHHPRRAWRRRGWVIHSRHLIDVVDCRRFERSADLAALLPAGLPVPFGTADLARALRQPRRLAQRMAYCLRETGVIVPTGKKGNSILYVLCRKVSNAQIFPKAL
jgi:hypothetical protein